MSNAELGKAIEKSTGKAPASSVLHQLKEWKDKNVSQLEKFLGEKGREEAERLYLVFVYSVNRNPDLLTCSKSSLIECLLTCAQLRLYPGPFNEAALVPYKNEAQVQPMYPGLIKSAMNTGILIDLDVDVVHQNDFFDFQKGTNKFLEYKKTIKGERGDPLAAFACASLRNGGKEFEVMTQAEIEVIKNKARSKSGPWQTDELAMWKKTAIKQLCKLLPKQGDAGKVLAAVIDHDNAIERPDLARKPIIDLGPDGEIESTKEKEDA